MSECSFPDDEGPVIAKTEESHGEEAKVTSVVTDQKEQENSDETDNDNTHHDELPSTSSNGIITILADETADDGMVSTALTSTTSGDSNKSQSSSFSIPTETTTAVTIVEPPRQTT